MNMKNKILFVACLIFGLLFINAGLNKIFNYLPQPTDMPEDAMKMFMGMIQISWLMPLIAVVEITGGVLFIVKKTRALGAVILSPILAGILLTHLTVLPSGLPMAIALLGIYTWVIVENREKYFEMVKS
jgi:uncharacterized membrane protein YphA (DoxX/SURF4 family)